MRVGFVAYINALPFSLPFKLGLAPNSFETVYEIPSKLNNLLKENCLDAALTSSVEFLEGRYQLLKGYGIAAHKGILSVNLYHKKPLALAEIAITHHSATSVSLLKILCAHWKIEPKFIPLERGRPLESYDAFLLIGDEALEKTEIPGFETIDLALAWYEMTKLPFVFALFSVRAGIDEKRMETLKESLEKSLSWSENHFDTLLESAMKQTGLPKTLIGKYYSLCKYRLQQEEMEGLEKFNELRKNVQKILP